MATTTASARVGAPPTLEPRSVFWLGEPIADTAGCWLVFDTDPLPPRRLEAHDGAAVAWTPDGAHVVWRLLRVPGSRVDRAGRWSYGAGAVCVSEASQLEVVRAFMAGGRGHAISPDGWLLASVQGEHAGDGEFTGPRGTRDCRLLVHDLRSGVLVLSTDLGDFIPGGVVWSAERRVRVSGQPGGSAGPPTVRAFELHGVAARELPADGADASGAGGGTSEVCLPARPPGRSWAEWLRDRTHTAPSPDGRARVAMERDADGVFSLVRLDAAGTERARLRLGGHHATTVAFAPGTAGAVGRLLAGTRRGSTLWDLRSGRAACAFPRSAVGFAADGASVFTVALPERPVESASRARDATPTTTRVCDLALVRSDVAAAPSMRRDVPTVVPGVVPPSAVVPSAGGWAGFERPGGVVELWDLAGPACAFELRAPGTLRAVSPRGPAVVTFDEGRARTFALATPRGSRALDLPGAVWLCDAMFARDGSSLFVAFLTTARRSGRDGVDIARVDVATAEVRWRVSLTGLGLAVDQLSECPARGAVSVLCKADHAWALRLVRAADGASMSETPLGTSLPPSARVAWSDDGVHCAVAAYEHVMVLAFDAPRAES